MEYREQPVVVDQASIEIDEVGFLHAKAKVGRVGVQRYFENGVIKVDFRSRQAVEDSLASFENKPVTLGHPASRIIKANDASELMKGFMNNLRMEGDWMVADIHVTHEDAVKAAQTSHSEFSLGYWAERVDSEGSWTDTNGIMGDAGETYTYDRAQQSIKGNHVALVSRARAGRQATFTDREDLPEDVIIIDYTETKKTKLKKAMKLIINDRVLDIEGDDASQVSEAVITLKNQVETLQASNTNLQGVNDGMQHEIAEIVAKLEASEARVLELEKTVGDADSFSNEVAARTQLWTQIAPHLGSDPDYSLTQTQAKSLYLASVLPELASKIADADESYIEGLWAVKQPEIKAVTDTQESLNDLTAPKAPAAAVKVAANDSVDDLKAAYQKSRANFYTSKSNKSN